MEQNMTNVQAEPANVTKSSGKSKYISEIAPASLLYAVFFTFCVYKNVSGIAYPFLSQELSAFLFILSESPVFPGKAGIF